MVYFIVLLPVVLVSLVGGVLVGVLIGQRVVEVKDAFLFVLTFAAGVVAGYLSLFLREWLMRPRLRIFGDRPMRSGEMIDHVLVVKNEGRTAAKNCIGMVTLNVSAEDLVAEAPAELQVFARTVAGVTEQSGTTRIKYHLTRENFRPVRDEKTCWADIPNPVAITINPKLVSGLEMYRVIKPGLTLLFPSEGGWGHIKMALTPREYHGRVVVSAENAEPVEAAFRIIPDREDVRIELLRHSS